MTVTIEINKTKTDTMSIEAWNEIGKLKGYCKANKILMTEVTNIEYTPNQPK